MDEQEKRTSIWTNVVGKGNTGKDAKKFMTFIARVLNIIFKTKSKN